MGRPIPYKTIFDFAFFLTTVQSRRDNHRFVIVNYQLLILNY